MSSLPAGRAGFRVATVDAQSPARPLAGDFQVGDRIVMRVDVEPQLTDSFTVTAGPAVLLPIIGSVSLAGVRRDQIEKVLTDAVAKFYRNPVVHARALVRIAILGQVLHPGFYAVPAEMLVPDVLMVAGGPTTDRTGQRDRGQSRRHAIHTRRRYEEGDRARNDPIALGIRSEDQFVVPLASDSERTIRIVAEILAIPIAIVTVLILTKR